MRLVFFKEGQLQKILTVTGTALNPYLHVHFEITATFSTVLHAHLMYKSIAKDCKKICMALF